MIKLFHIPRHTVDTAKFSNLLHDEIVKDFENNFAEYVGAKYACSANSASSLLYLALRGKNSVINIPSNIPIVVPNVIINSGNQVSFYNDIDWVGHYYHLYDNIFDSAQQVTRNQYKELNCNDSIMIFSFYPTKPVSGCDGGMIVSNNKDQVEYFRSMTLNGTRFDENSWVRKQVDIGYKMHCNSIQAYIANQNLKNMDRKNSILDEIRSLYNENFYYNNTSNHLYRIRVKNNRRFLDLMNKHGICCGIHYDSCHNNPIFKKHQLQNNKDMSQSEIESNATVSIPFHENLTKDDLTKVVENVKKLSEHN
jgi:dTDP-4-amino-4,6-dideoxygalactose transaminase